MQNQLLLITVIGKGMFTSFLSYAFVVAQLDPTCFFSYTLPYHFNETSWELLYDCLWHGLWKPAWLRINLSGTDVKFTACGICLMASIPVLLRIDLGLSFLI